MNGNRRKTPLRPTLQFLGLMIASMISSPAKSESRSIAMGDQVSIFVEDSGPINRGPTIILIPGWGSSSQIWRHQAEMLESRYRVIAIDPRSQGRSSIVSEGVTPEQRARDLEKILMSLRLDNVVLVGWSQGVQDIAAYVEAFGTGRIAGTVLVDSSISKGASEMQRHPESAAAQLKLLSLLTQYPEEYAKGFIAAIIRRDLAQAEKDRLVKDVLRTPSAIAVAMVISDIFGEDRTAVVSKLDRPTLVIASETSAELQEMRDMASQLPAGKFAVVGDAGHALFIDQPDRFSALLSEFLTGLPDQPKQQ